MVIDWLLSRLDTFREREAMHIEDRVVSYEDIWNSYRDWVEGLHTLGIQRGDIIGLEGDYSPSMCGAILACMAKGTIIVPLTEAVRHKRLELLAIVQASKSIVFDGDTFRIDEQVLAGPVEGLLKEFRQTEHPGLILFTSGSTGAPKAILHDLSLFLERYKEPRATLRTLTFLLFDHIGGFNTLLHTIANGGTIITPQSRTPDGICSLIEKYRVELLPTSPSFLNLLLMSRAYMRYDLSSLQIITYGTEVIPDSTLSGIRNVLPHVELRQTYGLSEVGILRAKSKESGSPWLTVGGDGVETKIVDGQLHIRSRMAMVGYLNAPSPFDDEGWMNTQDEVIEEEGYMRILGRRSEIINVGGRKVYPVEVENVLLMMPELADVTVKGEPNPVLGHMVTATANLRVSLTTQELKDRVRLFCRGKLEEYQIPIKVYIRDTALFTERYKKVRK